MNHHLQPHRRNPLREHQVPKATSQAARAVLRSRSPHQHLPFPILSSCSYSFPSLLSLPTSPSRFLSTPWPTLTSGCRDTLGKQKPELGPAAPGPRRGAGHLAPRPGGRWLRKLRTNPGVRPAPRPCPRYPLISSCHLPMLPLWKSHQRSCLPPSATGATAGPPLPRSSRTLSLPFGPPWKATPLE